MFAKRSLQLYAASVENIRRVTDLASLKAVAHPLRVRLLGTLRVDGPATATELARKLDESSGATSYHLRQLARFGFIEEDPEQPNARDRRWRAAHRYTSWTESHFAGEPEGREVTRWLRRRQRESAVQMAERFEEADWSAEWRDVAGQSDDIVRLTPASVRSLTERVHALIQEYAAHDAAAGDDAAVDAEQVTIFLAAFPIRGYLP
ncbi:MAG: helix-turn-helix domain-containing protein [Micromonosporaceae bacterium]|nr:helix-turn-helix domain-containing protein [Micromonosporaceae bacterium]